MLIDIINDLKNLPKEKPNQLLERLITERLQLALNIYYNDLNKKFTVYDNFIETNVIKAAKTLIK